MHGCSRAVRQCCHTSSAPWAGSGPAASRSAKKAPVAATLAADSRCQAVWIKGIFGRTCNQQQHTSSMSVSSAFGPATRVSAALGTQAQLAAVGLEVRNKHQRCAAVRTSSPTKAAPPAAEVAMCIACARLSPGRLLARCRKSICAATPPLLDAQLSMQLCSRSATMSSQQQQHGAEVRP